MNPLHRLPFHTLAAAALAALLGLVLVAPANAEGNVVFRDHFTLKDSHIEQEEHEDFCDVPFLVRWDGRVTVTETAIARGRGDLEYFRFHVSASDTFTNLETGESFRSITTFTGGDQKLTLSGDILTVEGMDRFSIKLFDSDGRLVAIDSGLSAFTLVIDLNDLENPDDDVLISETITKDHGLRTFGERDFCEDILTFLG
jgi:hypothetical protein